MRALFLGKRELAWRSRDPTGPTQAHTCLLVPWAPVALAAQGPYSQGLECMGGSGRPVGRGRDVNACPPPSVPAGQYLVRSLGFAGR